MSNLVYIHGTNGSGKSTLARVVISYAGGVSGQSKLASNPRAVYTHLKTPGVVLAGKYGNACGGVDGIHPYADVHTVLAEQAALGRSVLAEGLVTPGVETCQRFAALFDKAVFIALDVPDTVCIDHVLRRRARAGNVKEYSPDNLLRKGASTRRWAQRLQGAGLQAVALQWLPALHLTLSTLGVQAPATQDLIGSTR